MSKKSQEPPRQFTVEQFDFKEQIGSGKFGIVYRAIHKEHKQVVAIKVILKKSITSSSLHKQLQREIQIHSRLKHPNICELYAYFHDANSVYLVLEYCPHGSLATPIKVLKQRLSDKKIASIFLQLARAVAFIHLRNVMHRDLKLQNILLDENFNVKITDFGWCIHVAKTRETFCGTIQYICPEMIKKVAYGPEVDVYCLGIILYELYFEKSPFLGKDQKETVQKIQDGEVFFDDSIREIPQEAKELILSLLANRKEDRPKPQTLLTHKFIEIFLNADTCEKIQMKEFMDDRRNEESAIKKNLSTVLQNVEEFDVFQPEL